MLKTDFLRGVKRERGSPGLLLLHLDFPGWVASGYERPLSQKGLLSLIAGKNTGPEEAQADKHASSQSRNQGSMGTQAPPPAQLRYSSMSPKGFRQSYQRLECQGRAFGATLPRVPTWAHRKWVMGMAYRRTTNLPVRHGSFPTSMGHQEGAPLELTI